MNNYDAVFFDFDGVLARTCENNFRAWRDVFARLGVDLDRLEYFLLEGKTGRETALIFLDRSGLDPALADRLVEEKHQRYARDKRFALYEGASELITQIGARGLKVGVVSGGSGARIKSCMPTEMLRKLDLLISGEDCKESKPSPQPYLLAAKTLGVAPARCLVVENAPLGIISAKVAGMNCVAVASTLPKEHLTEADRVVSKLADLSALI